MTLILAGVRVTQARVRVRVDSARGETHASIFQRVLNVGLFICTPRRTGRTGRTAAEKPEESRGEAGKSDRMNGANGSGEA